MEPLDPELRPALRHLREQLGSNAPSPALELRLRAATIHHGRGRSRVTLWIGAGIAAAAILFLTFMPRRITPRPPASSQVVMSVSEFVPVRESALLPPPADPRILRVSVPRATLTSLGFPLPAQGESRVLADIVVGEDGLTRAVRLVKTTSQQP